MEAAGAVDAQHAPTAPWNPPRTGFPQLPQAIIVLANEREVTARLCPVPDREALSLRHQALRAPSTGGQRRFENALVMTVLRRPPLESYRDNRVRSAATSRTKSGSSCSDTIPPAGSCVVSFIASSGSFIIRMAFTPTCLAVRRPSAVSVRNRTRSGGTSHRNRTSCCSCRCRP